MKQSDQSKSKKRRKRAATATNEEFDAVEKLGIPNQLIEVMGLKDKKLVAAKMSMQYELCICEGWHCNAATVLARGQHLITMSVIYAVVLSFLR